MVWVLQNPLWYFCLGDGGGTWYHSISLQRPGNAQIWCAADRAEVRALAWQILLGSLATIKLLGVPPVSSPTNGRPVILWERICGSLPQTLPQSPTKLSHKSLEKSILNFSSPTNSRTDRPNADEEKSNIQSPEMSPASSIISSVPRSATSATKITAPVLPSRMKPCSHKLPQTITQISWKKYTKFLINVPQISWKKYTKFLITKEKSNFKFAYLLDTHT